MDRLDAMIWSEFKTSVDNVWVRVRRSCNFCISEAVGRVVDAEVGVNGDILHENALVDGNLDVVLVIFDCGKGEWEKPWISDCLRFEIG